MAILALMAMMNLKANNSQMTFIAVLSLKALMAVIAEMAIVKKIMSLRVRMTLRTVKTGCNFCCLFCITFSV